MRVNGGAGLVTTRAIILAAGVSSRLRPLTDERPKCLLPMGQKTILDWQLESLQAAGVSDFVIVVGYRRERIEDHVRNLYPSLRVRFVVNEEYETTNTLFSLNAALAECRGDFYYLNADVVFDEQILFKLAQGREGGYIAIDRKQCREEEVKVMVRDGQVYAIGKHLDPAVSYGEFIGVANFSGEFAERFRTTVHDEAVGGNEMRFFEHALDVLADKSRLIAVDITGLACIEIDFPEDYDAALHQVQAMLGLAAGGHE